MSRDLLERGKKVFGGGKKARRFKKDGLGDVFIIGVGGFVPGLVVSEPVFDLRKESQSGSFPKEIFLGAYPALLDLGDMLQVPLNHLPGEIHRVLKSLDPTVPQQFVLRILKALGDPGFELKDRFFKGLQIHAYPPELKQS